MAMPYGYCCITESFVCGTKSLMRGLMFESIHLLKFTLEFKIYKHGQLYKNGVSLSSGVE